MPETSIFSLSRNIFPPIRKRVPVNVSDRQESVENAGSEKKFWTWTKVLTEASVFQHLILSAEGLRMIMECLSNIHQVLHTSSYG